MLDRALLRGDAAGAVEAAVRGGVDWVQVRERALPDAALLALADAAVAAARRGAIARGAPARVLVNRRADVALAVAADGVHLGFDAMDVADARRVLGDAALVGISTHAPDELRGAPGLSYAHLAPIFAPLSKAATRPALGLAGLAEAARWGVPLFAQGGIDCHNARAAIEAGAAGVAVTGAILMAEDPGAAARALREALDA
ncbi:MAG TPA: thiamine phosphate synthase [Myxococcota bacterium]